MGISTRQQGAHDLRVLTCLLCLHTFGSEARAWQQEIVDIHDFWVLLFSAPWFQSYKAEAATRPETRIRCGV